METFPVFILKIGDNKMEEARNNNYYIRMQSEWIRFFDKSQKLTRETLSGILKSLRGIKYSKKVDANMKL